MSSSGTTAAPRCSRPTSSARAPARSAWRGCAVLVCVFGGSLVLLCAAVLASDAAKGGSGWAGLQLALTLVPPRPPPSPTARSCGSMSHKTKDCMERPRNKGARWTNKNIAADEKVGSGVGERKSGG